jgi:hypothetical protein
MRVAYYGAKAPAFREDYAAALKAWDGGEAWDNGARIQIQISRSKRVLPQETHEALDTAQQAVVDDLDTAVEHLRERQDPSAWEEFYKFLWGPRRDWIHELLFLLTQHLAFAQQAWLIRRWRSSKGKTPASIGDFDAAFVAFAPGLAARTPNGKEDDSVERP